MAAPQIETTFDKVPCGNCDTLVASFHDPDAYAVICESAAELGRPTDPVVLLDPEREESFAVALHRDTGFICPACGLMNFVRPPSGSADLN